MAQANGSTNGYLSSADWTTFNGKQASGSYISALTGDVTAAGAGSAVATLAAVAIAGTSTKVTYDVKGRVTSGTALTAADLPSHSAALITSGALAVANGGTGLSSAPANGQIPIGNGTNYNLATLTAGTGISINNAAGAVTVSTIADASTKVSRTGDTMTGSLTLAMNGLIAGTNQLVLANGNVGIGTTNPSAILDVNSTTSGFLPPRLTTAQRNAIASPSVGLTVYNTTSNLMEMYNGVGWVLVGQNMPEGAIMAFAATSCPAGWAEYSAAYGRFLRGIDKSGTSIDLGGQRVPGNIQDQDWKGFSMTNTGQNYYGYSHGPVDMGKSTSAYTGNLFTGYWSAPAAGVGTKWNTNDEVRPKNVAVLYCRYSGGSGVSVPAGANQVIQDNSSVTVTDSGTNGAIALATEGTDRLNINANGNVGIGTTNPQYALDVNGATRFGCPSGMVDSGAGFCIDSSDSTETAAGSSFASCASAGKLVCSFREICTSVYRGVGSLGTNYRYSDIMYYSGNNTSYLSGGTGSGNTLSSMPAACSGLAAPGPNGGTFPFRCCRGKG
jgi:hypothetical protein